MAEEASWKPTRNERVTVGTSSIQICGPRSNTNKRDVLLVRNISGNGNRVSVLLGNNPAVANTGIILEDGESFSDTSEQVYECWQGPIQAISSAVAATLSIFER